MHSTSSFPHIPPESNPIPEIFRIVITKYAMSRTTGQVIGPNGAEIYFSFADRISPIYFRGSRSMNLHIVLLCGWRSKTFADWCVDDGRSEIAVVFLFDWSWFDRLHSDEIICVYCSKVFWYVESLNVQFLLFAVKACSMLSILNDFHPRFFNTSFRFFF